MCKDVRPEPASDAARTLERIHQFQQQTTQRLHSGPDMTLPEIAELCEDIANRWLDIADDIRDGQAETGAERRYVTPERSFPADAAASPSANAPD